MSNRVEEDRIKRLIKGGTCSARAERVSADHAMLSMQMLSMLKCYATLNKGQLKSRLGYIIITMMYIFPYKLQVTNVFIHKTLLLSELL